MATHTSGSPISSGDAVVYQALFELPSGELRLETVTAVHQERAALHYTGPQGSIRQGLELPSVRLFQGGTQVLACAGTVEKITPTEQGRAMDVALKLRPASTDGGTQIQQVDIINTQVKGLLEARANAVVCVTGVVLPCTAQLMRAEGQPSYLVLEIRGPTAGLEPKANVELTCQLYGARVVLRSTIIELKPGRMGTTLLHVRWPHAMAASRRRTSPRVQKLAVGAYLTARLPFAALATRHVISDLSRMGLAFEADASSWITPGMVVPKIEIHLPTTIVRGRGSVRNVRQTAGGKLHVGLAFHDLSPTAERTLDEFVSHNTHPTSRPATARDITNLWPLLREAGLLQEEQPGKVMRSFEGTRSLLLTRAPQLLMQTVQGNTDLTASAELVRVAEKGWRLQHILDRDDKLRGKGVLEPLLQSFTKRYEGSFLQLLWPVGAPLIDETKLYDIIPDPHMHARLWGRIAAVRAPALRENNNEEEVHAATPNDRQWVARRLQRMLTPIEMEAIDGAERKLQQMELSRLYRSVGLEYTRLVRLVSSVSEALGFSLVESSPLGLGLDGLLPCARLFAVEKSRMRRQGALASLAQDAANWLQAQGHAPNCLVTVEDADLLKECGYKVQGWVVEITVDHGHALELPAVLDALRTPT
jgi:c-di-GMP-binding flagellar brake protein YcgR